MLRLFGEYENFPAEDSLKTYFDDTLLLYLYINTFMEIIYMYGSARRGDYYLLFVISFSNKKNLNKNLTKISFMKFFFSLI